jgi:UDP-GlcNAc:undecaprenyl-phosphate GlcNAc-1-phosphate transferase
MYSSAFLAILAFLFCLGLTPLVRALAIRWGIIDEGAAGHNRHGRPVARLGGVAIWASYFAAFAVLMLMPLGAVTLVVDGLPIVWRLLPAAAIVFAIGLIDDTGNLSPKKKLLGQIIAAAIACWGGVAITSIGGQSIPAWLAYPITIGWLVFCSNAMNLIDGLDGLAAGLGLVASLTMFASALLQGNDALALATAPLAGALLAFLVFNSNPASIFLGDSGSLVIGFLLGCFGVIWSHKTTTMLGITAPLVALAVPLLDTTISILRRFLKNRPIFAADRGHIHHRLLDRGLTPRAAAYLLYAVAAVASVFALLVDAVQHGFAALVLLVFCGVAVLAIRQLRFVELDVAGELIFRGGFRRIIQSQVALRAVKDRLEAAGTPVQCWTVLREAARAFGFVQVRLALEGAVFEERFRDSTPESCWTVQIPLTGADRVDFEHNLHYAGPAIIGPFMDLVCRQLRDKRFGVPEPLDEVPAVMQPETGRP